MKRSLRSLIACGAGLSAFAAAAPAFAQTYGDGGDGGGAAAGAIITVCFGIFWLLLIAFFVFWIVMLVDLFQRQEWEFPNSKGSSKTTWLIIMLVSWFIGFYWLVAILYYFMVYKKIKRGTMAPPAAGAAPVGYPPAYAPPVQPGYAPAPPPPPPAPPAAPQPPAPPAPEPPAPPAPPAPEPPVPPAPEPPAPPTSPNE